MKTTAAATRAAVYQATRNRQGVGFWPSGWLSGHRPAMLLFGLVYLWRLWQVRQLALPAWVDSVHHALLVRMLLEQGWPGATWAPYLPEVPFYYHFGFHSIAAIFAGVFGVNVGQAVLLTGQMWQAVMAVGVYALSLSVWHKRTAGLIAMLLVGFVSQMPAYFSSWGRYPLLAGLALLSLAMAAAISGRVVSLAVLTAATALTHAYAFLMLLLFLAIRLLLPAPHKRQQLWGSAAGLLLASPWLAWLLARSLERRLIYVEAGADYAGYSPAYLLYLLGPARNFVLLALAGLGLLLGLRLLWRERDATRYSGLAALVGWSVLLLALLGPWRLGPFRPDLHAALVLFLPVVVLAAGGLCLMRRTGVLAAALGLLTLWGVVQTSDIINPATVLATPADVAALEWLADNTPPAAIFLVDVAPWEAQWRGVDGGWWITPLTGRQTVLPPTVYGWGPPSLLQRVRATAVQLYALRQAGPDYCERLTELGQRSGATYYYTRSARPAQCAGWQQVYGPAAEVNIYAGSPLPQ